MTLERQRTRQERFSFDPIVAKRAGIVLWSWSPARQRFSWIGDADGLHALPEGSLDGYEATFRDAVGAEQGDRVMRAIERCARTGEAFTLTYHTPSLGAHSPRWLELTAAGHGGEVSGTCRDVTARVTAEEALARRVRRNEKIEALSRFALTHSDLQAVLDRAVETAAELFEVPLAKILQFERSADQLTLKAGIGWNEGLVGQASVGTDKDSQAGFTLMSDEPVIVTDLRQETRFSGPPLLHDHDVRSGMSVVIAGAAGRPFGVFGVHATTVRSFDQFDVDTLVSIANVVSSSARHAETETQLRLLVGEMAHRSGNLLQLVNTIANQSFAGTDDPAKAQKAFRERLSALSRTNESIARNGWASTRLTGVVEETLRPFPGRYEMEGRNIVLLPELCFDLGLVLHELATNSAKYGTLGQPEGKVRINWRVVRTGEDGRVLKLQWIDARTSFGGTGAAPGKGGGTGFGSKLKRALIADKWGGKFDIEIDDGYRFDCAIPIEMAEGGEKAGSPAAPPLAPT
ncbi:MULTISPECIES: HWE histidine kinase domain-containing protein [unclassified Roseitalea]|uniref:sensor histidine kinase n=1 Tax=unclassified Roseitalea TaxID=2639107 RepID=UPI00273F5B06|nr:MULTISPECIES: HWE histidine kinase domain-containing protein [unclassified Roseitalea]